MTACPFFEVNAVYSASATSASETQARRAPKHQPAEASMVKWWDTELCNRITDRCVQLHGGYGCMREHSVGRAWTDSRVQSISAAPLRS